MKVEPQQEHRWLQALVGEWTYEGETVATEPGGPQERFKGTESVRPLGEVWVLGEGKGEMPDGGTATTLITLGYDPKQRRFVGTWIGSMMTHLWVYAAGTLDADGRTLTLEAQGPSFSDPDKLDRYQDVMELVSADHRVLRSRLLREDGTRHEFMVAHYRRA
jgi:hypothetical protein